MARRRPRGRRAKSRSKSARPRGLRIYISSKGTVLNASLPAPVPENWEQLRRYIRHPPGQDDDFVIPYPAVWNMKPKKRGRYPRGSLQPAFRKLLTFLRHRHASGVSLQLHLRYGESDTRRSEAVAFTLEAEREREGRSGDEGLSVWSEPFATSKSISQARHHLVEFMDRFYLKSSAFYYTPFSYIYRVGVALLHRVGTFRHGKKKARHRRRRGLRH
jgi:hypothetical protein